jgi:hypothetical protein
MEINELQHPDSIWTWKSNTSAGIPKEHITRYCISFTSILGWGYETISYTC